MKAIKFLFSVLIVVVVGACFYYAKDDVFDYLVNARVNTRDNMVYSANKYYRLLNISYVSDTDDFNPKNRQDLLNIIYTVLNTGLDEFRFYCTPEYTTCVDDVKDLISDETEIADINNFVHPYNSYSQLYVTVNSLGEINMKIKHRYSKKDIKEAELYINDIISSLIKDGMTDKEKIKVIHDYIINNTRYDEESKNDKNSISHKANGLLTNHLAICGGYADTMAVFLDKFGIANYKVSSTEHIWNYVYLDGKWLHLDLTWDDPVTDTKEDIMTYDYFLIDNETLAKKDSVQHNFDTNVYREK